MAVNKNAQTRYRILDKCFSNPVRKYFIEDLLRACNDGLKEINPNTSGIQKRQLFDDIRYMESAEGWNAPIDKLRDGKRIYYRYSDRRFSIDNQPLNQAEIEQLKSALNLLTRFKGMPQFEWVHEFAPKIEQSFLESNPIISFDNNSYLKGIEHLGGLFHHILYKRTLCVTYQSYKRDTPIKFIIHPYYLKQYNNRWFLLGLNDALNKLTTLALDRIIEIEEDCIAYLENSTYDFNEYFEDIIGVTVPENGVIEHIVLKFNSLSAPYVLSKPLHGSQKIISKSDEDLIVSLEVIPNYELESLILSFGERIKVLEPAMLVKNISYRLKDAIENYQWC